MSGRDAFHFVRISSTATRCALTDALRPFSSLNATMISGFEVRGFLKNWSILLRIVDLGEGVVDGLLGGRLRVLGLGLELGRALESGKLRLGGGEVRLGLEKVRVGTRGVEGHESLAGADRVTDFLVYARDGAADLEAKGGVVLGSNLATDPDGLHEILPDGGYRLVTVLGASAECHGRPDDQYDCADNNCQSPVFPDACEHECDVMNWFPSIVLPLCLFSIARRYLVRQGTERARG